LAWATPVHGGQDADDIATLRRQLQEQQQQLQDTRKLVESQQTELRQLGSGAQQDWLNQRRAEEVKALVREVLSDADTRASLADQSANAGFKGGFFIADGNNTYMLKINGLIQAQYVYNHVKRGPAA